MEALVGQVEVNNCGSIWIIRPLTDWASQWLADQVGQEEGDSIMAEPRNARDILDGMLDAWLAEGQTVSP